MSNGGTYGGNSNIQNKLEATPTDLFGREDNERHLRVRNEVEGEDIVQNRKTLVAHLHLRLQCMVWILSNLAIAGV